MTKEYLACDVRVVALLVNITPQYRHAKVFLALIYYPHASTGSTKIDD